MFDTKTEARRWLNERLAEVAIGHVADAGGLTVGRYFSDWLGSLGVSQLEAATYRGIGRQPGEVESGLAGALETGVVGVVTGLVASIMLDLSDEDRKIEARRIQLLDVSDIERPDDGDQAPATISLATPSPTAHLKSQPICAGRIHARDSIGLAPTTASR